MSPSTAAWTRVAIDGTVPSGAASFKVELTAFATGSGQTAFADLVVVRPPTGLPGNLLPYNAESIETDTSGWSAVSGCTVARSTVEPYRGAYSLAVTFTDVTAVVALAAPVSVTPGDVYQFMPWTWPARLTQTLTPVLQWLDASGNVVNEQASPYGWPTDAPTGAWWSIAASGVCPPGATQLSVTYSITGTVGDVWYFDAIYLGPGGLGAVATPIPDDYAAQISLEGLTTQNATQFSLYRQDTDGTLTPVRGQSGDLVLAPVTTDLDVETDYEAPLGVPISYMVEIFSSAGEQWAIYTSAPIVIDAAPDAWHVLLKDPTAPARNMLTTWQTPPEWTSPARQATYVPLNSTNPIVRYDVRGSQTGTLALITMSDSERAALTWLLAAGDTLLMQAPPGCGIDDVYVQVGDVVESRVAGYAQDPIRTWQLPLTVVGRPSGPMVGTAGRTWQDVADGYGTWRDVLSAYQTWMGVLLGVEGS
jgi:hypothetical protein